MFEQLHRLFTYTVILLVGCVVAIFEVPFRAALFWIALVLYVAMVLTAPLWVNCYTEKVANFIKDSLNVRPIWMKKVMRAYRDALL
jgi:hypothetical protein